MAAQKKLFENINTTTVFHKEGDDQNLLVRYAKAGKWANFANTVTVNRAGRYQRVDNTLHNPELVGTQVVIVGRLGGLPPSDTTGK